MADATKIDANLLLQEWMTAGIEPKEQAERIANMINAAEPWVLVLARRAAGRPVIEKIQIIKQVVKLLRPMPEDDRKIFMRLAADDAEASVEMFEALMMADNEPVEKTEAVINVMRVEDGETSQETRFHLYTAADALKPQEPIDYIVDGVFAAGSLSVVVGDPGCKKTWAMIDMETCVAVGDPWLGHSTRARSVLFIDEDNGRRRVSARIGKALRAHGGTDDSLFFYTSLVGFNFGNSLDVDELQKLIIKTSAALVVIDILINVIPGQDENSAKDLAPVLRALRYVAEETQAAIVLIHHLSKGGLIRGTTAINGAVDLALEVDSKSDSCDVNFKSTKARDVAAFNFSGFAHFSEDKFYMTESEKSSIVTLSRAQELVIQYLAKEPGATLEEVGQLAASGSVAERTMVNACRSLAGDRMGYTKQSSNGGGRGQKATWSLTEKGIKYAESL
jgi:predicted ATP-dependent serine protease